ncbi:MAG: hypothetical protein Q9219_005662 [cf. Caloplaca sp. 3 TL-2023]
MLAHQPASTVQRRPHPPRLVTHELNHTPPTRPTNKIADWFNGESDPITLSILPSPTREVSNPSEVMLSSTFERTPTSSEKPSAARNLPKPAIISRFSLFGNKPAPPKAPLLSADVHDEWHELDIKSALIPSGSADPFSPSAFKNLQQNAEGLLLKLQAAYKQRSQALHDVLAEKEVQAEELEGAEMKTKHLKLQLDGMTAKLADQDKAMMDLVDQLAQEKQARRQAEAARGVINQYCTEVDESRHNGDIPDSEPTEKIWKSRPSTASDMSIESEGSCTDSVFSRHGATSPTMSLSSVSTLNSPETQHQLPPSMPQQRRQPSHTITPLSAFRAARASNKFKQTEETSPTAAPNNNGPCAKCSGHLGDSEAWNLVSILQLENKGLKSRLGQLEDTVDDCLIMVKGLF